MMNRHSPVFTSSSYFACIEDFIGRYRKDESKLACKLDEMRSALLTIKCANV
jgi:hypothetical protein